MIAKIRRAVFRVGADTGLRLIKRNDHAGEWPALNRYEQITLHHLIRSNLHANAVVADIIPLESLQNLQLWIVDDLRPGAKGVDPEFDDLLAALGPVLFCLYLSAIIEEQGRAKFSQVIGICCWR